MDSGYVTLNCADLDPRRAYALLANTVLPRPIAFVSTLSPDGAPNLAPFSFFNVGGANPPSLVFSPTLSSAGAPKDTLRNVEATGEYTVNLVHREMADGMNRTGAALPYGESEWESSGFHRLPSVRVRPARVAESLAQFECRLFQIVRHGSGPGSAVYVIGEVLQMHFAASLWEGDRLRAGVFPALGRLGGADYVDLGGPEVFEMVRP